MLFSHIRINKNRGWRGLAEVVVTDDKGDIAIKNIFSFSQAVWTDMIYRKAIVVQDSTNYYIIRFDDTATDRLPKPTQQRSVLIKNFRSEIKSVQKYEKISWTLAEGEDYQLLHNFKYNKNNHTTSDWNCIGIRVIPEI